MPYGEDPHPEAALVSARAEIERLRRRVAVLEDVIRDNLQPGETAPLYDMVVTNIHDPDAI